jgi:hypothetical protein
MLITLHLCVLCGFQNKQKYFNVKVLVISVRTQLYNLQVFLFSH